MPVPPDSAAFSEELMSEVGGLVGQRQGLPFANVGDAAQADAALHPRQGLRAAQERN
jgi:hypothetical protein